MNEPNEKELNTENNPDAYNQPTDDINSGYRQNNINQNGSYNYYPQNGQRSDNGYGQGNIPPYGYSMGNGYYPSSPYAPQARFDPYAVSYQEKAQIKRNYFGTFMRVLIHVLGTNVLGFALALIAQLVFGYRLMYNSDGVAIADWKYLLLGYLPSTIACLCVFLYDKGRSHISIKSYFSPEGSRFTSLWGTVGTAFLFYVAGIFLAGMVSSFFYSFGYNVIPDSYSVDSDYSAASLACSFILVVVIGPICEELLYRGVILRRLANVNTRFGIVMSALFFGLMHGNLYQAVLGFCIGLVLGYAVTKTGSILPSILAHMAINLAAESSSYAYLIFGGDELAVNTYWIVLLIVMAAVGLITLISLVANRKIQLPHESEYARRRGVPIMLSCVSFYVVLVYLLYEVFSIMERVSIY